jgi:ABC-2 type transport system ATP-binding protein
MKVKVTNLKRLFTPKTGIFDVSMEIQAGEIVGFIGPNGAGKTTTMLCMLGLQKPDGGTVQYYQDNPKILGEISEYMPKLGVAIADTEFETHLKVKQILRRHGQLFSIQDMSQVWNMAEFLDLDIHKRYGELSLGNKRKVAIIVALSHYPDIVIMDEPTSGLDPLIQKKLYKLLTDVTKRNGTVLMSSHVLSNVEAICDRFVMIKEGYVVMKGNTQDILNDALKLFKFPGASKKFIDQFKKLEFVNEVEFDHIESKVYVQHREPMLKYLNKIKHYMFYLERPTLEEMFIDKY